MVKGRQIAARWKRNVHGGIALSFAVMLPLLLAIAGLAADYALMSKARAELQEVADASALAGAREIPLAMSKAKQLASAVMAYAAYRLTAKDGASDADFSAQGVTLDAQVIDDFSAVKVTISKEWQPFFMHLLNSTVTPLTVTAEARFVGRNNICVLGLGNNNKTVFLDKSAKLAGNNCGVFSNSAAASGLTIDAGAYLDAKIVCSSGGTSVSTSARVTPAPVTDCPRVDDPLAQRAAPAIGKCNHDNLVLDSVTKSIDPGVYCGGLTIRGSSRIILNPGIYVIKDGGLVIAGQAAVDGDGLGFYITGTAGPTNFAPKTHVSLTAAKNGALAGLLLFEDRNLPVKLKHRISSDDARTLLGTIYLPVGGLVVDASRPVADQSAYTAIVAQTLELNLGPNLILNSDYEMTDVPVPAGIAGSSQVVLSN